jgi:NAD(P)-dependent dehydrogenase (short-subunit alcohol dehydrogenase family)
LVNNAGIAGPTGGIDELSCEDWRHTIDVNLNGQFYCSRLAVPMLKQSDNASIICLSSVAGRLGYAYRTPYAATKWAIIGLIKSLAIELGPHDIRVNALLPGIVEGPRIEQVISARAETVGVSYEAMEEEYIGKISLRKMTTAKDVANQALFLCSPLGANISGQPISICGNVEYL